MDKDRIVGSAKDFAGKVEGTVGGLLPVMQGLRLRAKSARRLALATVAALATPAFAAQTMSSLPSDSFTITDY
jgi:hypothetical protein